METFYSIIYYLENFSRLIGLVCFLIFCTILIVFLLYRANQNSKKIKKAILDKYKKPPYTIQHYDLPNYEYNELKDRKVFENHLNRILEELIDGKNVKEQENSMRALVVASSALKKGVSPDLVLKTLIESLCDSHDKLGEMYKIKSEYTTPYSVPVGDISE